MTRAHQHITYVVVIHWSMSRGYRLPGSPNSSTNLELVDLVRLAGRPRAWVSMWRPGLQDLRCKHFRVLLLQTKCRERLQMIPTMLSSEHQTGMPRFSDVFSAAEL